MAKAARHGAAVVACGCITKRQALRHYESSVVSRRLYVIHKCKKLKQLDFRKVKQKEREEATQVFASAQQPADASAQGQATTFEPDEELAQAEAAAAAAQQQVGPCHVK